MPDAIDIGLPVDGGAATEGDSDMAADGALFNALMEQNMAAMGQVGTLIQVNMQKVDKAFDYSYLQDKDLVSLQEAVGVREVASRVNPAGPVPATAKD